MAQDKEDWKNRLSKDQYKVMRKGDTEKPFSGNLLYNEQDGIYVCAACGAKLFASEHKFDALCGWPSFNNVITNKAVVLKEDLSHSIQRVEVTCAKCGSHLGHVFNDAPDQPTGMRFCINSVALNFKPNRKVNKSE